MQKSIQHYLLTAIFAVSLIFLFITHPVNAFADSSDINNLSFIYVERSHVDLGDTQRVALGFDGTPLDEPVALYCANTTSEALVRFDVTSSVDGTYLFSSSISCTGVYSLLKLEYASGATSIFPEDISDQSFSVGEVAAPYRLRSDSGSDDQPESVFTDGAGASFDSLESAVNAISENSVRARNWVFVLDAGHGGWDSGAVGNGLREKDLTLQIARYCRDELQKYAGVRVIMTRDSDASVTGVANTTNELIARAQIARDNNATLFMSFHINSGGGTGAEIWIPRQASWYSSFNELGESLGQDVLNRLASVGLVNRGTKNDYYDLNGTQLYYPDGSNADSLSVIRNCRQYGIPAVLVEHGFIDNSYDAGLLANSLYLQKMGQADALAIANQFGLSKEAKPDPVVSEMRDGKIKLSWDSVPNASKYAIALCKSDGSFNTYTYDCAGTSYEIGGLENGKTYTFLVQAYANGRWNTFTFDDYLTCKLVPSPEAQAEATGDGEVTVSWKAVAGAERYAVAERLADGSYRTYTLDEKGTSFKVSDLANGVTHRFLVQARVDGSWSSTADGYLCSAAPSGTVRPKVSAKAGDRSVELTWGHVPGATRYAVAVRQGSGYKTYTLDCAEESYTVKGLSNGTSYKFLVQAWNGSSWSPFSDADLVACRPSDPRAPEAQAEATGDGEVTVSWKAVAGAERYAVAERLADGSYRTYTLDEKGTSFKVSDLANGVTHRFLVQARVDGSWSSTADGYLCSAAPSGTVRPKVSAKAGDRSVELTWGHVPGATRYAVAVRQGSGYKTYTLDCAEESYTVKGLSNGTSYKFLVQAWNGSSWSPFSESDLVACTTLGTPIMGKSAATVSSMVSLFKSTGHTYPTIYASKGATTINDFCQIVLEEANAEGVKAEILFAQAMLETGWLQFGGSVKAEQCNFGGIGAINTSAAGVAFDNVRIGLRAQVQHLKAYASSEPLNTVCVDPRFNKVDRGIAPCLEDLDGRWAVPGVGYGKRIALIVAKCC